MRLRDLKEFPFWRGVLIGCLLYLAVYEFYFYLYP